MKRKLFFVLLLCLFWGFVSSALAATTLKRIGVNPFSRSPLTSEADLTKLVKSQNTQIKNGFAKAGYPDLYKAFSEQFASAKIDSIKVPPGETFQWMLFKKKGSRTVTVSKDVTWGGAGQLDAFRFYIDNKGKRYEFVVLNACGNLSLKKITGIPLPAPMPATPEKAAVVPPAPMPATPEKAAVASPAPMPAPPEKAVAEPPAPVPAAKRLGGPVVDAGFIYQFDPADYLFARIGYEFPLFDKLSLLAFVGGASRINGEDGGSSFIADAILDYHWLNRLSFGVGAGYWSDDGGQVDLIANLGILVFGNPDSFNGTLFLEGRSDVEELDRLHYGGRLGLGIRFRF